MLERIIFLKMNLVTFTLPKKSLYLWEIVKSLLLYLGSSYFQSEMTTYAIMHYHGDFALLCIWKWSI